MHFQILLILNNNDCFILGNFFMICETTLIFNIPNFFPPFLGKQRHIRLIPVGALDSHDVEWIKVADTKGCLTFDTACYSQGCSSSYVFCIALKRQVIFYRLSMIVILYFLALCIICRLCCRHTMQYWLYNLDANRIFIKRGKGDTQLVHFLDVPNIFLFLKSV